MPYDSLTFGPETDKPIFAVKYRTPKGAIHTCRIIARSEDDARRTARGFHDYAELITIEPEVVKPEAKASDPE